MQYNHNEFITSPILSIIQNVVSASNVVGDGLEFYCISGNILHSLFLQLTGAQEQKCKCICWDLATINYEYRYERFNKWDLSECSRLKDKNVVFADLVKAIRIERPSYKVFGANDKRDFLKNVIKKYRDIFDSSSLASAYAQSYSEFCSIVESVDKNAIEAGDQIFKCSDSDNLNSLSNENLFGVVYQLLYKHRNRCAHNTLSYQENLPSLVELNNQAIQKYYNIFLFMFILVLIDELYIRCYKKLIKIQREK